MTEKSRINLLMAVQWSLLAVFGLSLLVTGRSAFDFRWLDIIGGLFLVGGIVVGIAALQAYRRRNDTMFVKPSPTPRASDELVTNGIYARIRHPIYLAVILVLFGAAIINGHWSSYIVALLLAMFYFIKLQFEESLLLKRFPQYAVYQKSTGALLPRLIGRKTDQR